MSRPRLVDLGHPIDAGMAAYPGLPDPAVCDFLSRSASRQHDDGYAEFDITRVERTRSTSTTPAIRFNRCTRRRWGGDPNRGMEHSRGRDGLPDRGFQFTAVSVPIK